MYLADNKEGYGVVGNVVNISVDEKYLTEDGKVNVKKIRALAYDQFNHDYYEVSKKVGKAFSDGRVIQSSK